MKTCLIVEPNRMIRAILRKIMDELRFDVIAADSSEAALAAAGQAMPDVVMLEWDLPTDTGLNLVQTLRALPDGNSPVILFCAAQTDPDLITAALAAGANDFIMKPFDAEIVRSKFALAGLLA